MESYLVLMKRKIGEMYSTYVSENDYLLVDLFFVITLVFWICFEVWRVVNMPYYSKNVKKYRAALDNDEKITNQVDSSFKLYLGIDLIYWVYCFVGLFCSSFWFTFGLTILLGLFKKPKTWWLIMDAIVTIVLYILTIYLYFKL